MAPSRSTRPTLGRPLAHQALQAADLGARACAARWDLRLARDVGAVVDQPGRRRDAGDGAGDLVEPLPVGPHGGLDLVHAVVELVDGLGVVADREAQQRHGHAAEHAPRRPGRRPRPTTLRQGLLAVRVGHEVVEVQQDRGQRQTSSRPDGDAGQVEHGVGDQQVDREQGEAPRDEDLGRRPQGGRPDGQDVAHAGDDEAQGEPGGDGVERAAPPGRPGSRSAAGCPRTPCRRSSSSRAGVAMAVRARQPEALEGDPLDAGGGEATGEPGGLGAARRSASGSR